MDFIFWLFAGVAYGLLIGLIPVAGATTGLVALFPLIHIFQYGDPYLGVVFITAVVAASAIGDSFASIVMNIPGSGGSAATMVDGFPLARQGRAAYALSSAITTSTVNGLIWGLLVFLFLPYYANFMMLIGTPEMWALLILASVCMIFVNSRYWFRGLLALALGVFLGLVGLHPSTGEPRFTGGWFYLADGIQLVALVAGILAFPELIAGLRAKSENIKLTGKIQWDQILQGFRDSWKYRRLGLRGGLVGAVVGALPGLGGNIADWIAYSQTVATCKNEKIPFGKGNIKGVIGCEGANNSHKATAYLPTVLFGIPGAPFAAVVIGLFMYLGFEMGSISLLDDQQFFSSLSTGYLLALLITFPISILAIRWLTMITVLPFRYFFWPILLLIVWSSVQYTGGWEDYAVLFAFCIMGLLLKWGKFSRPALIVGFVLAEKIESLTSQVSVLYSPAELIERPLFITIMTISLIVFVYGTFFYRSKIEFV